MIQVFENQSYLLACDWKRNNLDSKGGSSEPPKPTLDPPLHVPRNSRSDKIDFSKENTHFLLNEYTQVSIFCCKPKTEKNEKRDNK